MKAETVVIERYGDEYKVFMKDEPKIAAVGKNIRTALGDFMRSLVFNYREGKILKLKFEDRTGQVHL